MGEYMTVEEIEKKYKDVIVLIRDAKLINGVIQGGVVFDTCGDTERISKVAEYRNKGIDCCYISTYDDPEGTFLFL